MEPIKIFLMENFWITIAMIFLAVVSVSLTIYFGLKSRRFKRLSYFIESNNLIRDIGKEDRHLKILYDGHEVENVTISRIAIWNSGTEPILKNEIAHADPIQVIWGNNIRGLKIQILHKSKQANNIILRMPIGEHNPAYAGITFDFLDRNDGCILQLVHTGLNSDDLKLRGTIIGSGEPIRTQPPNPKNSPASLVLGTLVSLLFIILVSLLGRRSSGYFRTGIICGTVGTVLVIWGLALKKNRGFIKVYLSVVKDISKQGTIDKRRFEKLAKEIKKLKEDKHKAYRKLDSK